MGELAAGVGAKEEMALGVRKGLVLVSGVLYDVIGDKLVVVASAEVVRCGRW